MRELDNQGTELDNLCVKSFNCTRGMIASRTWWCLYGKAHTRQIHTIPTAVSGSGDTRKQVNSLDACHPHPTLSRKPFLAGCSSPFMRLAQHLTALRAWCKQMSAWSVKTRRAPSRHCREARAYGLTTTAMHNNEYTPSSPPCTDFISSTATIEPDDDLNPLLPR